MQCCRLVHQLPCTALRVHRLLIAVPVGTCFRHMGRGTTCCLTVSVGRAGEGEGGPLTCCLTVSDMHMGRGTTCCLTVSACLPCNPAIVTPVYIDWGQDGCHPNRLYLLFLVVTIHTFSAQCELSLHSAGWLPTWRPTASWPTPAAA